MREFFGSVSSTICYLRLSLSGQRRGRELPGIRFDTFFICRFGGCQRIDIDADLDTTGCVYPAAVIKVDMANSARINKPVLWEPVFSYRYRPRPRLLGDQYAHRDM